jgi:mono/diheme cytochrome c family protein
MSSLTSITSGGQGLLERRLIYLAVLWAAVSLPASELRASQPPDFGRDIFPIFRRSCLECHGAKLQEADLRLDDRQSVFDHYSALVPGDAENSALYSRTALPAGHDEIMPAVGKPLTKAQTELIRRWIDSGADWPEDFQPGSHWAYVAPSKPQASKVSDPTWPRNPLDAFILNRLDQEGLTPSPEADPAMLIRRVYLDLIGLPPSPAEVKAFIADPSDAAYRELVDRLLASPQFGERWARPWLDLARYADSHGFQRDDLRQIWAYRDWVIQALNDDMPFDQFTIEQLAGDLLPQATESQKIATGFHRCTMTNVEAGTEPEETRTNQVIDRVNTTATVWLGTTLECAQCHDHKYDPFTQKDYYQLLAFFNNTALEADRRNPKAPGSIQFLGPRMTLGGEAQAKQDAAREELAAIETQLARRTRQLRTEATAWEERLRAGGANSAQAHVLEVRDFASAEGAAHSTLEDGSVLLSDDPPDTDVYTFSVDAELSDITAFKLEALTHESLPGGGPGRGDAERPNFVLNEFEVSAAPRGSEKFAPVRLASAKADFSQRGFDVARAIDGDPKTAWAIAPEFFAPHWAQFHTKEPLTYADGVTLRFRLVQRYGGGRTIGRLRISAITGDPTAEATPANIARILGVPKQRRTKQERRAFFRFQTDQDEEIVALRESKAQIEARLKGNSAPTTLVMQELAEPRKTMIFDRGDYRQPTDQIDPGVPAVLHQFEGEGRDRLGLAKWLVDRRNPLVARVTVNRWWAEMFGGGLVETVEDFGVKGEPPTHPELLDWLAVEFMDSGWSMKHVLRTIVSSATYRQSSRVTPELLKQDDQNKLYARGPRVRMDAETIRDNALSIAGLLSLKQFGAPIRPYQPDGLWVKLGGEKIDYIVSPGEDRYRRGVYVVLKRGAPYPSFVNFDASDRLACKARRSRSNTPLQALTLLNDPVYVEAAAALAVRSLTEQPNSNIDSRINYMFQLCVCREASPHERSALRRLYEQQLLDARRDPNSAKKLVGSLRLPPQVSRDELAAWFAVATALLNLDATITKG